MNLASSIVSTSFRTALVFAQPHQTLQPAPIVVVCCALDTILDVVRITLAFHCQLVTLLVNSLLLQLDHVLAVVWVATFLSYVVACAVGSAREVGLMLFGSC